MSQNKHRLKLTILCIVIALASYTVGYFVNVHNLVNRIKSYPKGVKYHSILDIHKKIMPNKDQSYYIMLGNSITHEGPWHELFNNKLILNRGIPGDDIEGITQRLYSILALNPQKIFLMCGINDLLNGKEPEYIFIHYKILITEITESKTPLVIQSVLFTSHSKVINQKVKELNLWLSEYCLANNIEYIDLNSQLSNNNTLLSKYTYDGIHLTADAYLVWANLLQAHFD